MAETYTPGYPIVNRTQQATGYLPARSASTLQSDVVAALGDSRIVMHGSSDHPAGQTSGNRNALGFIHWARGLAARRFTFSNRNLFGISGQRTDQYKQILDFALNSGAKLLVIFGHMNNVGAVGSYFSTADECVASTMTDYREMAARCVAAGVVPIFCEDYPANGHSAAQKEAMVRINVALSNMVEEMPGTMFFRLGSVLIDPTATTYAVASSTVQADGVHLLNRSAYKIGKALAPVISDALRTQSHKLCSSAGETKAISGGAKWLTNPLFITKNGGTYGGSGITTTANGDGSTAPGASGSGTSGVPPGGDVNRTGSATVGFTIPAGNVGNRPTLAATFTAAGEEARFKVFDDKAGLVGGEKFVMRGKLFVTNPAALSAVHCYLECQAVIGGSNVTSTAFAMRNVSGNFVGPDEAYEFVFETEPLTIPAGVTINYFNGHIRGIASGAGAAVFGVEQVEVEQVNR